MPKPERDKYPMEICQALHQTLTRNYVRNVCVRSLIVAPVAADSAAGLGLGSSSAHLGSHEVHGIAGIQGIHDHGIRETGNLKHEPCLHFRVNDPKPQTLVDLSQVSRQGSGTSAQCYYPENRDDLKSRLAPLYY